MHAGFQPCACTNPTLPDSVSVVAYGRLFRGGVKPRHLIPHKVYNFGLYDFPFVALCMRTLTYKHRYEKMNLVCIGLAGVVKKQYWEETKLEDM
eukprot:9470599-Pyramimonas_sp.AAC.1